MPDNLLPPHSPLHHRKAWDDASESKVKQRENLKRYDTGHTHKISDWQQLLSSFPWRMEDVILQLLSIPVFVLPGAFDFLKEPFSSSVQDQLGYLQLTHLSEYKCKERQRSWVGLISKSSSAITITHVVYMTTVAVHVTKTLQIRK